MLNTIPVKQHLGIQELQTSEHVDPQPRSAHLPFSGLLNSISAFPLVKMPANKQKPLPILGCHASLDSSPGIYICSCLSMMLSQLI